LQQNVVDDAIRANRERQMFKIFSYLRIPTTVAEKTPSAENNGN